MRCFYCAAELTAEIETCPECGEAVSREQHAPECICADCAEADLSASND